MSWHRNDGFWLPEHLLHRLSRNAKPASPTLDNSSAAMDLAFLRRDIGQRTEVFERLVSIYEGFTAGFDTVDLKEVKEILDGLS